MSLQIQLKKSSVSQKQPFASDLAVGELALNYNAAGPFLTCKDTAGNIRKLNNVWVSATAPTSPSAGDLWLDISTATAVLKVFKSSVASWVNATTIPLATTTIYGTVQLATTADITNGTALKVVDAAQLQSKITTEINSTLNTNPLTIQGLNIVNNLTVSGDLTVNGNQTIINTTVLDVEDKNIVLGNVATPSDTTADGGGISLLGTTTKTFNWVDATDSWTSSENINLASGKSYRINNVEVLSATALGSSVQISSANIPNGTIVDSDVNASAAIAGTKISPNFGSQNISTTGTYSGTWQGSTIATNYGGTGQTTYTDGQLLIGKTDGTLAKSTLTAGSSVVVTNGNGAVTVAVQDGTTAQKGAVQLEDSVASTSTSKAATPNSVKSAYDLANAALPKAGGTLTGDITLNAQYAVRFADADSSNWVALRAPTTVGTNVTWTLPAADGTSGQALTTDGTGQLSWTTTTLAKIEQGNTSAEVVDSGSNGRFVIKPEGTEAWRVTSDTIVAYSQGDITVKSANATFTAAELKTKIIQITAGAFFTLPTGTDLEAAFDNLYNNFTFEWSLINTGGSTAINGNTNHTFVGTTSIAASTSTRFATRRTAANTFVTYRIA